MFKEAAYWMYYFWSKNKRARKDKAVISNATWTMEFRELIIVYLHLFFHFKDKILDHHRGILIVYSLRDNRTFLLRLGGPAIHNNRRDAAKYQGR